MTTPISGEEREKKQFVAAIKDGYVPALPVSLSFCSYLLHCCLNLIGKFRLVIEDGLISSSNLTKLHASAAQVFKLTANDLFDQDDLLQDTRGDTFNYRTYHACRRRSFGHRACSRQVSLQQSSCRQFDSPK